MLLSRKEFRERVFERDGYACVICASEAQDAHHIMERRLFPAGSGGYYLDNGASLCGECHLKAEKTEISVEELLDRIGGKRVTPPHLYRDQVYTKWGDPVLENGTRLKGELFEDESVRKVLRGHLDLYTDLVKYPRTYHLPFSEGITEDDRVMEMPLPFEGKAVVVTEKMDGENTSMYSSHIHARSLDSRSHPSQDWVKNFWSKIRYDIPEGWRVCGENLYAKHSIHYRDLPTYFMGFSVWNERNECLSWDETLEYFELLGITPVPIVYRGEFSTNIIIEAWDRYRQGKQREKEGYVLRTTQGFHYRDFKNHVAKYVRNDHLSDSVHWFYGQKIVRNELA